MNMSRYKTSELLAIAIESITTVVEIETMEIPWIFRTYFLMYLFT